MSLHKIGFLHHRDGVSSENEAKNAGWQKGPLLPLFRPFEIGELELWVTLGMPSEKIIRQSCGKADAVIVYCYGGSTAELWWEKIKNGHQRTGKKGQSPNEAAG